MSVSRVVSRALREPAYAKRLKEAALKAQKSGFGSREWDVLLSYFAKDPDELLQMKRMSRAVRDDRVLAGTTTITTVTTGAGPETTFTTTTTTTTDVGGGGNQGNDGGHDDPGGDAGDDDGGDAGDDGGNGGKD